VWASTESNEGLGLLPTPATASLRMDSVARFARLIAPDAFAASLPVIPEEPREAPARIAAPGPFSAICAASIAMSPAAPLDNVSVAIFPLLRVSAPVAFTLTVPPFPEPRVTADTFAPFCTFTVPALIVTLPPMPLASPVPGTREPLGPDTAIVERRAPSSGIVRAGPLD
jgi:hypothetical protein